MEDYVCSLAFPLFCVRALSSLPFAVCQFRHGETSAEDFSGALRGENGEASDPLDPNKWVWVKNRYPKWNPGYMETWTETCGPLVV